MTLRKFMEEHYPEYIDFYEEGGVKDCPEDYQFLRGCYSSCCSMFSSCYKCWNQEYKKNN